ncbi:MAG: molybdopterin-dependent oxidoreductase, partial [Proteobacteria bacterium]|nr:molybdopterin-dependent oxidoreductase [Pseudomonadota bacterium]
MAFEKTQLSVMLLGMEKVMKYTARLYPAFRDRVKEKNLIAQIKIQDNSQGRYFVFREGKVTSKGGIHSHPDVTMIFRTADIAVKLLRAPGAHLSRISAMKNFQIALEGPDDLTLWFSETLNQMLSVGTRYGTTLKEGVKRYTSNTNGGPVFVYVKKGKILRITPIEFDETDATPWTIEARGKRFTPPRKTTISPHALGWKSMVYSPDRLLYPMKRVDFDPAGDRNCHRRGLSGYERISWDEALDVVAGEIRRVKREHGPGAIMNGSGSHHTWGHLGYWLSARIRFFNTIGFTPVVHNPDSWEGWYWGAMHHWGQSMRLGGGESYGTVEDCLRHCEMVVFWSSDPEATSGVYGASEGTIRRQWLKELGIKMVHIDPYYNHT